MVVSSFFADIFKGNALNNSILPVQVSEVFLKSLFEKIENNPDLAISIELEKQIIKTVGNGMAEHFKINEYKKDCLMNGFDDIDYLLNIKEEILAFENAGQ